MRIRRLGKFTKKENDKEEEWEEPHEDDVPDEVWVQIRDGGFGRNVKMRDLKWIWSRRAKLAEQVELLELGKAGGVSHKRKRTSGAMRQACVGVEKRRAVAEAPAAQEGGEEGGEKMLMREVKRLRSSALEPIFDEMIEFDGLMVEFVMACERKLSELKRSKFFIHQKLLSAIDKRLAAMRKCSKKNEYTLRQTLNHVNARLMKPQRMVSLSFEEEERRCCRTWWRFDEKLHLACFKKIEELAEWVKEPKKFRENVRQLIIWMNDQIPMWLKIKPGKQIFAEYEVRQKSMRKS